MRAVVVKLYPTKVQEQKIVSHLGAVRFIFNTMLHLSIVAYERFGISFDLNRMVTRIAKLKRRKETAWLKEIAAQPEAPETD